MINVPRRALESVVVLFALYAFVFVPLGQHTGLEHVRAILSTPEAERASDELKQAGSRMLAELMNFNSGAYRGEPVLPQLGVTPDGVAP